MQILDLLFEACTSMIMRSCHSQPSKNRRWLEECEPSIPGRQTKHGQYLAHPQELSRNDAAVLHVLIDQRQRRQQETYEVGLHKGSLDLPVVDFSRPPYDESLRQHQAAIRTKDGAGDAEFSLGFGGEEYGGGRGEQKAERPDQQRGSRMDGKQSIEASFW